MPVIQAKHGTMPPTIRERASGEMRATAGKPARGPAANPRRGAPVTGRQSRAFFVSAKQGGTAKQDFVPAKERSSFF